MESGGWGGGQVFSGLRATLLGEVPGPHSMNLIHHWLTYQSLVNIFGFLSILTSMYVFIGSKMYINFSVNPWGTLLLS